MYFMNKRGISTIVASVLIVLVAVAGVTILWVALNPLINEAAFVEDPTLSIQIEKGEYTAYDQNSNVLSLKVNRGPDESEIVALKFLITSEGNTEEHISYDVVSINSGKVYSFLTPEYASGIEGIKVVPIYDYEGEERESTLSNEIDYIRDDIIVPSSPVVPYGSEESPNYDLTDGLVVYYPYSESVSGAGNMVSDYSGNEYHGTLRADAFTDGTLHLDGANDGIRIENSRLEPGFGTTSFSASSWVYLTESRNNFQYIFSNSRNCCSTYNGSEFVIFSTGQMRARLWHNDGSPRTPISIAQLGIQNWYHVTFIYDSDNSVARFYVDGVLDREQTFNNALVAPPSYDTYVGCMAASPVSYCRFNGMQDDFRYYSRALSDEEVMALYNSGRTV
jgi:hypothetical protein